MAADQVRYFESKIRPVLVKHCYECHSGESKSLKGGLLLDSKESLLTGGDSGPGVVPGNADESLLLSAMKYEDFEMPPSGKLPEKILNDFEIWIKNGATDPRTEPSSSKIKKEINWKEASEFWSFRKPQIQQLPKVEDQSWPLNRIDTFVLAKLEANHLAPTKRATDRELNRRLAFDLTGLPPTNIERDIDRVIETLLASPAFGEKWARLWLDIARYAEDQAHIVGNNQSLFYPNAYRYRNWVINAFNDDQPYNDFVVNQLAIDLVAQKNKRTLSDEDLSALGFIGIGPKYYRRNDLSVMADEWEDRVDSVSRGLLGLTVACARCHDHKYDPITTEDYYALAGVFASTEMYNKPIQENQSKVDPGAKKKKSTPKESIHIVRDSKVRNLNVFIRGDSESKGTLVERRFLQILDPEDKKFSKENSGRLELAKSITDPSNPLLARVIVNRVWAKLIGKPIVGTMSNFGELGERPTHPKLLDDLASRFVLNGWSVKWLVKEIVSSQTYQQSCVATEDVLQKDSANSYLSRMNRKRLSIEQWRDAILLTNEQLVKEIGGKSIDPSDIKQRRRTIYSQVSRFQLNSMLAMFDFPDPNAHAAKRSQTISPLQKMFALNSQFLLSQAKKLNDSMSASSGLHMTDSFVEAAYQRLFQRRPIPQEYELAKSFLSDESDNEMSKRSTYLQTLLISNEFTYVD